MSHPCRVRDTSSGTFPGSGTAMELEGVSPLRTLSKSIEADCYNKVRLAVLRLPRPVRVELPRLRLEMELDRSCWIARSLVTGAPMLSWCRFVTRGRALHQPVTCELHLYHTHAGLLMGTALDHLCIMLDDALSQSPWPRRPGENNRVDR
ncbi:MAG: hypothetical protein ACYCRH_04360 [Acidiferrobacteraceae bacterium]